MQAIRRVDTKSEVRLRAALHALGYRFRKDLRVRVCDVWVRPDVVFTRWRLAVFVDGCFWHACPEHGRRPNVHKEYWQPKLEANIRRDRRQNEALSTAGWTVVRLWEHESLEVSLVTVTATLESIRTGVR